MFEELDELARGLAENDISRRQAIKWAGYSVLGTALSSVGLTDTAEALTRRQRRRCRRQGGTICGSGHRQYCCAQGTSCGPNRSCQCPNPATCATLPFPQCGNDPGCQCATIAEGGGTCVKLAIAGCAHTCTSSADCQQGQFCVVNSCCPTTGVCADRCTGIT